MIPTDFLRLVTQLLDDKSLASSSCCSRTWQTCAEEEWIRRSNRRWKHSSRDRDAASPSSLYGLRHTRDIQALSLLDDMQWPDRRDQALQALRGYGADVLDVLLLAARCRGPGSLSLAHWAQHALAQVKTHMVAEELQRLLTTTRAPGPSSEDPTELVALCIAAVHHPQQDVDAALHVLDQLAAEARLRLGRAVADKVVAAAHAQQLPARHSSTGGAAEAESLPSHMLTVHEVLKVINELLFGSPAADTLQQQASSQPAPGPSSDPAHGQTGGAPWFHLAPVPDPVKLSMPPPGHGLGLEGNKDDFYSPANSLLPDVLLSGKGIPISLAIIHRAVCRRVGLDVQLVNMPMRVIARLAATRCPGASHAPVSPRAAGMEVHPSSSPDRPPPVIGSPPSTPFRTQHEQRGAMPLQLGSQPACSTSASMSRQASLNSATMSLSRQASASIATLGRAFEFGPANILPNSQDVYIDVFNGGSCMDEAQLKLFMINLGIEVPTGRLQPLSPKGIATRMCANLIDIYQARREPAKLRMMLQLSTAATPGAKDLYAHRLHAALAVRDYADAALCVQAIHALVLQGVTGTARLEAITQQTHQLTQYCRELQEENQQLSGRVKARPGGAAPDPVHFCIGQVIHHKQYNYRGVIYSWDETCAADPDWVLQMGVEALPGGSQQPFYGVLVDERDRPLQNTYVAQCNLELLPTLHVLGANEPRQPTAPTADQQPLPGIAVAPAGDVSGGTGQPTERSAMEPPVRHPELGAYFMGYDAARGCFMPNASLVHRFPDDPMCRLLQAQGQNRPSYHQQQASALKDFLLCQMRGASVHPGN